jgi:hypothetical protein
MSNQCQIPIPHKEPIKKARRQRLYLTPAPSRSLEPQRTRRKPLLEIYMSARPGESYNQACRLSWSVLPLSRGCALRRGLHPQFQARQKSILTGSTGSLGLLSLKTRQTNILSILSKQNWSFLCARSGYYAKRSTRCLSIRGEAGEAVISEDKLAWVLKSWPNAPILTEDPVNPVNLPEAGKSCLIFLCVSLRL